ncbi:MAG: heme-copper oxidase subunit III [Cryomorphaceae bacterium]|nr:MAG: heme-copper oxidase subunit III [Cryomorphaceae bacterium]
MIENVKQQKLAKAKKMMLLFGLLSITMTFAGLTSAYIVSKGRPDWTMDFNLPSEFFYSTFIIVLSSLTLLISKRKLTSGKSINSVFNWTLSTFILGLIFIVFQFIGFNNIIDQGYYFAGAQSAIKTSFIYVLSFLHTVHLVAGLIVLSVIMVNIKKGKYVKNNLGFNLGSNFWHYLDFLWLYLFSFFYFFG